MEVLVVSTLFPPLSLMACYLNGSTQGLVYLHQAFLSLWRNFLKDSFYRNWVKCWLYKLYFINSLKMWFLTKSYPWSGKQQSCLQVKRESKAFGPSSSLLEAFSGCHIEGTESGRSKDRQHGGKIHVAEKRKLLLSKFKSLPIKEGIKQ